MARCAWIWLAVAVVLGGASASAQTLRPAKRTTYLWEDHDQRAVVLLRHSDQDLAVAWHRNTDGGHVFCNSSRDAGSTWSSDRRIDDSPGLGARQHVDLAPGAGDSLLAVWQDDREGRFKVRFARGDLDCLNWSESVPIGAASSGDEQEPRLVGDRAGNLVAAWLSDASGEPQLIAARSSDGGATWLDHAPIAASPGQAQREQQLARGDGVVHAVWTDGDRIAYSRSLDNGASWSPALALAGLATAQSFPALAANGERVAVAWIEPSGSGGDLRLAYSDDAGLVWQPPLTVASSTAPLGRPAVGVDDHGRLHVAWDADRGEGPRIELLRSDDAGLSWRAAPIEEPGPAYQPWLQLGPHGQELVAWIDERRGQRDVFFTKSAGPTLLTYRWYDASGAPLAELGQPALVSGGAPVHLRVLLASDEPWGLAPRTLDVVGELPAGGASTTGSHLDLAAADGAEQALHEIAVPVWNYPHAETGLLDTGLETGAVTDTHSANDVYHVLYEADRDSVNGGPGDLEYVYHFTGLPPGPRTINVSAFKVASGDPDETFSFRWSLDPAGPFQDFVTPIVVGDGSHGGSSTWSDTTATEMYLQVLDSDPPGESSSDDAVAVDKIYISIHVSDRYALGQSPEHHSWDLGNLAGDMSQIELQLSARSSGEIFDLSWHGEHWAQGWQVDAASGSVPDRFNLLSTGYWGGPLMIAVRDREWDDTAVADTLFVDLLHVVAGTRLGLVVSTDPLAEDAPLLEDGWRWDDPAHADGALLDSALLEAGATRQVTIEGAAYLNARQTDLLAGQPGEWDFALRAPGAASPTSYHFRVVLLAPDGYLVSRLGAVALPMLSVADCQATGLVDDNCDGVDDDCDGTADQAYPVVATSCGVGACAGNTGALSCVDGVEVDSCDPLAGAAAEDASCDGVDDDCDGFTDDEALQRDICQAAQGSTCLRSTCDPDQGMCVDSPVSGCCEDDAACATPSACVVGRCELSIDRCAQELPAGCCGGDADCDDGDACTVDGCGEDGSCELEPIAGCCSVDSDCEPQDPCAIGRCTAEARCVYQPAACATSGPCGADTSCSYAHLRLQRGAASPRGVALGRDGAAPVLQLELVTEGLGGVLRQLDLQVEKLEGQGQGPREVELELHLDRDRDGQLDEGSQPLATRAIALPAAAAVPLQLEGLQLAPAEHTALLVSLRVVSADGAATCRGQTPGHPAAALLLLLGLSGLRARGRRPRRARRVALLLLLLLLAAACARSGYEHVHTYRVGVADEQAVVIAPDADQALWLHGAPVQGHPFLISR